jgi:hypothetical protein
MNKPVGHVINAIVIGTEITAKKSKAANNSLIVVDRSAKWHTVLVKADRFVDLS